MRFVGSLVFGLSLESYLSSLLFHVHLFPSSLVSPQSSSNGFYTKKCITEVTSPSGRFQIRLTAEEADSITNHGGLLLLRKLSSSNHAEAPWDLNDQITVNRISVNRKPIRYRIPKIVTEKYILYPPIDLTKTISPREPVTTLEFNLEDRKFEGFFVVNVAFSRSVEDLLCFLPKADSFKLQMQSKNDEVCEISQIISTKCPLSCLNISIPLKSNLCKHLQSFDAKV